MLVVLSTGYKEDYGPKEIYHVENEITFENLYETLGKQIDDLKLCYVLPKETIELYNTIKACEELVHLINKGKIGTFYPWELAPPSDKDWYYGKGYNFFVSISDAKDVHRLS